MPIESDRMLPDDPLKFIRQCVRKGNVLWTYHVNMRMKGRFIPRNVILCSTDSYEIIESYPKDKYFPSYLMRSQHEQTAFHVLFAADVEGGNVRVVTAYYPNPHVWRDGMRKRREKI